VKRAGDCYVLVVLCFDLLGEDLGEEASPSMAYWKHFVARFNAVHAFGYNSVNGFG